MLVATECKWCGEEFDYDYTGRGRAREFCCIECRNEYGSRHRKQYGHDCLSCGKSYKTYRKVSSFCSPKCASGSVSRKPRKFGKLIKCKACGEEKRVALDRIGFCSRKCAFNWRGANKQLVILGFTYCEGECGCKLFNGRKMCNECRALERAYARLESLEYRCIRCGHWRHKHYTNSNSKPQYCPPCRKLRVKERKSKERKSPEGRIKVKQYKKNRERIKKERQAQSDSFSDWQLFTRDRWQCQLCGRKVRKVLMQTNYDDEATVDHIVPLSRGGKHCMANCQTACRACNTLKGAKTLGQHRML